MPKLEWNFLCIFVVLSGIDIVNIFFQYVTCHFLSENEISFGEQKINLLERQFINIFFYCDYFLILV